MLQISPQGGSADAQEGVSFEHPLTLLLSCHDKVKHFSSALVTLSLALKKEGWNEQLVASSDQIRRYFNVAAPEHHLDEEEHLFPAIIALDPELKKPQSLAIVQLIHRLIKEHVESDSLWESLDGLLAERSNDFARLGKLSADFKREMHTHADIENEQIFPYAKANMSDEILKAIGLSIAKRRGVKME
ncbi:hemerythrin domain-containing protein [sulfur-oxidizing endosymbiont of Gigantopelta aegis]|uniref:hemerythrin domain-containing protein n=1 Tax=sulfur-oxidizing endosymbiont of Gigantopelta aegis TaxID=2794934 RepID=UPI0018DC068B|nr:hemerythrin domain-containing protein [sulfur-oxidizing endosymbiont of Gigantopelta aegis]